MPSTYTSNGGIEKIATGEQSGTWGDTTNLNFDIIDRITNGVGTIDLSGSGAAHTLQTTDGTLSDGMYRVLVLDGATEACTITVSPNDAQKLYFVNNTSGFDCTFSQGSGSNVSISNGTTGVIFCDGAGSGAAVTAIAEDLSNLLVATNNLSDLDNAATALTNLGLTATAAELNIMDGVTATTAELNYNDITTLGTSEASKVVTADANGDVTLSEELIAKSYNETKVAVTSSSGTATLDLETANFFSITLTENTTFAFSNPPASGTAYGFLIEITQGASAYTISYPAGTDFVDGTAPDAPAANEVDVVSVYTFDGGTSYKLILSGNNMS